MNEFPGKDNDFERECKVLPSIFRSVTCFFNEKDFLFAHPIRDVVATHHHRCAGMNGGGGKFRPEAHFFRQRACNAVGVGFIQAQQDFVVVFQDAVNPLFDAVHPIAVAVVPSLAASIAAEFAVAALAVGNLVSAFETVVFEHLVFHNGQRCRGYFEKARKSRFIFLKFDFSSLFPHSAFFGKNAKTTGKRKIFPFCESVIDAYGQSLFLCIG